MYSTRASEAFSPFHYQVIFCSKIECISLEITEEIPLQLTTIVSEKWGKPFSENSFNIGQQLYKAMP